MMLKKVSRVWNTVRYMTPRQWKYRLYYTARNKLKSREPKKLTFEINPQLLPSYYSLDIENKDTTVADGILRNEFPTISGMIEVFEGDWDLKSEKYRLVCFNLNSFKWLLDLSDAYKATGKRKYINKGFELINDWCEKCGSIISGDKWNAYVIAERVKNWIGFCSKYATDNITQYANIIYSQAQELKDSLEFQLGANHLLSEAKALIYAGVFLRDDELYKCGKMLLFSEAKEQFLPDGGHYERSVSYHVESIQQYFESYAVMKTNGDPDIKQIAEIIKEPYRFLNGMIAVNGKIPLFNDSANDYPFYDAADFLATALYVYSSPPDNGCMGSYYRRWEWLGTGNEKIEWDTRVRYEDTGYIHYKISNNEKKYSFFMDCGDNGPDYNLGHTHADALSILLYSENKEILVDSGVFTYQPGLTRDACRSTKAHNTVEIDEQNNAEIWSAFRVARRGHTNVTDFSWRNGLHIKAYHDGYEKILKLPVKHIREVKIKDRVIEICDELDGKGEHHAISRFHIGPRCRVEQIDSKSCLIDGEIEIHSEQDIFISDCIVSELFGLVQKTKCVEISFKGSNILKTTISL